MTFVSDTPSEALVGRIADAFHRSVIHTEENHRVIGRFQMDHAGLVPSIAHVVAPHVDPGGRYAVRDPGRLRLRGDQRPEGLLQAGSRGTRIELGVDQQFGLRLKR